MEELKPQGLCSADLDFLFYLFSIKGGVYEQLLDPISEGMCSLLINSEFVEVLYRKKARAQERDSNLVKPIYKKMLIHNEVFISESLGFIKSIFEANKEEFIKYRYKLKGKFMGVSADDFFEHQEWVREPNTSMNELTVREIGMLFHYTTAINILFHLLKAIHISGIGLVTKGLELKEANSYSKFVFSKTVH